MSDSIEPGAPQDVTGRLSASPRATAAAVGYLFQSVGLVFLFGACCFWSLSSHFVRPDRSPPLRWIDHFLGDRLPAAVLTVGVIATLNGGLGLIGAGIGLHGEKRGSGAAAVAVTGLLTAVYWTIAIVLAVWGDSWRQCIAPVLFALVASGLSVLALHAAAVMRKHPPPADQNVVTDDMVQSWRNKRGRDELDHE